MNHLDLFSGIGGFALGLNRAGFNTVGFCEIDPFCQKILRKHWPDVPIYEDVRTITEDYDGEAIELISGGYPCQPFSVAGKRKGADDDRHLWPAMFDCVKKFRPRWVIGENVAGHINMGLDQVLSDLESEGYEARAFVIPACAINAPHRRDRVWIVGNAKELQRNGEQYQSPEGKGQISKFGAAGCKSDVAHSTSQRQQGQGESIKRISEKKDGERQTDIFKSISERNQWGFEPDVGRVANGIPNRVDRLRGLGNAVIPQIPEMIGRAIIELGKPNKIAGHTFLKGVK